MRKRCTFQLPVAMAWMKPLVMVSVRTHLITSNMLVRFVLLSDWSACFLCTGEP